MRREERDRVELWLPLLRDLTASTNGWAVWKNADSALRGRGDVDSIAPREEWPTLLDVHRRWAAARGLGPVVVCRHAWPGVMLLLAGDRTHGELVELDVVDRCPFRGSQLFSAADLGDLLVMDVRGFRQLRPGAEGLFKLVLNGSRYGARADHAALEAKGVAQLLAEDPDGARRAARCFGIAARAARRAADAVREGGWDAPAMRVVEARALAKGLAHPRLLHQRLERHLRPHELCTVRSTISRGRAVDDVDAWTAQAAADHEVVA